jgi:thiamine-monophosphate kinase
VNEFALIARYFQRPVGDASVRLGIGDDAAIVAVTSGCELVVSVDMLVEGRHFQAGVDAESLGHKALAVNLSDLAAMGARPRWALLAGALPDADGAWLAAFARGLFALADRFGVELIGGDTTRGPRNLCVTIMGEVPAGQAITRGGARPGDDVWVSGTLGDAMLALAAIEGRTTMADAALVQVRDRLLRPEPRIALGQSLRGTATAALDVSDGLTGDLGHILQASGVGARVDLAAIPRSDVMRAKLREDRALALACLLAGGDDYELCFTAPPADRDRVSAAGSVCSVPVTRIGTITQEHGLRVLDESGAAMASLPRAFDHFPT